MTFFAGISKQAAKFTFYLERHWKISLTLDFYKLAGKKGQSS